MQAKTCVNMKTLWQLIKLTRACILEATRGEEHNRNIDSDKDVKYQIIRLQTVGKWEGARCCAS